MTCQWRIRAWAGARCLARQKGRESRAGIFAVIMKEAEHYSNLYDYAYMPTWQAHHLNAGRSIGARSGGGLGRKDTIPAAPGCVRMRGRSTSQRPACSTAHRGRAFAGIVARNRMWLEPAGPFEIRPYPVSCSGSNGRVPLLNVGSSARAAESCYEGGQEA